MTRPRPAKLAAVERDPVDLIETLAVRIAEAVLAEQALAGNIGRTFASSVGGGEVTVSLMGVKTVSVDSVNGGRWAETQPHEQVVSGADCIPSSGSPGFTTSDTRIIYDLAGNELSRETQTTVYDPQPIVRCG